VNLGVAKDQRLSLNPSQISGACGRLMCCLRYEHEFYVQTRKRFPKEGKLVMTAVGEEKVVSIDIFREALTLRTSEGAIRTIPLAQFKTESANRPPVPVTTEEEADETPVEEISPELMYTAEFAVPEPRLVILTESIEPEPQQPPQDQPSSPRPRRRRNRRGGRRGPPPDPHSH